MTLKKKTIPLLTCKGIAWIMCSDLFLIKVLYIEYISNRQGWFATNCVNSVNEAESTKH